VKDIWDRLEIVLAVLVAMVGIIVFSMFGLLILDFFGVVSTDFVWSVVMTSNLALSAFVVSGCAIVVYAVLAWKDVSVSEK